MININRHRIPAPRVLTDDDAAGPRERRDAEAFYADPANSDASFEFAAYKHADVKDALARLFYDKCAYCESRYGATQPMEVEHWRPKASVVLQNGREIRPGFFWLAAEWTNLLPSCIDCNRRRRQDDDRGSVRVMGKGNQFPVLATASPGSITDVKSARPLLLDPCTVDPGLHLEFLDEGMVRPAMTKSGMSAEGDSSIEVFALNRVGLALARREHALLLLHRIKLVCTLSELLQSSADPMQQGLLEELISHELFALAWAQRDDQPYAQLARQIVGRFTEAMGISHAP